MDSFSSFKLSAPLHNALERMGFKTPTPIQSGSIPLALQGKDLIACAQTGTGKTAAFCLPMLEKILQEPKSKVLIITPTRELANQILDVLRELTVYSTHIRAAVLIGGASMNKQINELRRNPTIVIGTPGRLVDHMERRTLNFSLFNMLILDEADRMFDMGFAVAMSRLFKVLPRQRQTLLFSATFSDEVIALAQKQMKSPAHVKIGAVNKPIERIKQSKVSVQGPHKNAQVLREIQARRGQMLIFMRTKLRTDRLTKFLKNNGVKAAAIHGGRTQSQRETALEGFREGYYPVLVATDVASRGLDIPDIQTVFNFDLPETSEDYIHRIGRTARAGAEGEAVSFVTPEEERHWAYLSRAKK